MDKELVELLFSEYKFMPAEFIDDLEHAIATNPVLPLKRPQDEVVRDALRDMMTDRIYDEEVCRRGGKHMMEENRECAKLIAEYYYGAYDET